MVGQLFQLSKMWIRHIVLGINLNALFCPTVGPILSGDNPGVSLYNVLILSRRVYIVYWR